MKNFTPKHAVYLLMLLAVIAMRYFNDRPSKPSSDTMEVMEELQSKRLIYTRHAECRMDCRFISEAEVKAALQSGRINYQKSRLDDKPCATYAVEDNTADGQTVRIVFANCDDVVKVVTAIDLTGEYDCYCK